MIGDMKSSRVSVVAAGATLALTATVLSIAPASGASGVVSGQAFQASGGVQASALALGKRKTKLKVKPAAKAVVVLTPTAIDGKVSGPKRKVILQLKNAYGWKVVDRDKSNKKGKYSLKAPTKWYGKKKMRVVVPPTRRFQGKVKKVAVKVTEGYTPLGSKGAWTELGDQKIRYNPCQKIKYTINPNMLPADGAAVLQEAVFRVEIATGLRYKYAGSTSAIPWRTTNGKEVDRKSNLAVAWSTPETDGGGLAGTVVGQGGVNRAQWIPQRRTFKSLKTGVLFDAGYVYEDRGFVHGAGLGAVVMHELVHATGMGHSGDITQIMYPSADPTRPALFGKGDLMGLKRKGQDAGCLSRGNARVIPGSEPEFTPISVPLALDADGRGHEH